MRRFDDSLIPPGINDGRIRWLWGAFSTALAEVQLTPATLCMRTSAEMSAEMLPLAVWELSLEEFMPEEGLPEHVVRRLIDRAYELHALKGTDEGVQLGMQVLLGGTAEIVHWWQKTPRGHHDTHTITVFVGEGWSGQMLTPAQQRAARRMIDATKRWSQDTELRFGTQHSGLLRAAVAVQAGAVVAIYPPLVRQVDAPGALRMGAALTGVQTTTIYPPLAGAAVASGDVYVGGAAA